MNRRDFVRNSSLVSGGLLYINPAFASDENLKNNYTFNLKYAPHFGMFNNMAGNDSMDQLRFIYDQGFRAFEDNGMKGKKIELPQKISSVLNKNNMERGVFVAKTIYRKEHNIGSGNMNKRKQFLIEIKETV